MSFVVMLLLLGFRLFGDNYAGIETLQSTADTGEGGTILNLSLSPSITIPASFSVFDSSSQSIRRKIDRDSFLFAFVRVFLLAPSFSLFLLLCAFSFCFFGVTLVVCFFYHPLFLRSLFSLFFVVFHSGQATSRIL